MRCAVSWNAIRCVVFSSTLGHAALAQPSVAPAVETLESAVESSRREFSVSLGARVERGDTQSGVLGFAALSVPLERFVNAPSAALAAEKLAEASPASSAGASESAAEPVAATPPPLLAAAELSRLARETVAAALRANGTAKRREELDRVASRARVSAALPELRLRGQRSDDESLRLTPSTEDPYRYSVAGGRDWLLEAQLTFRLGRLVFADEELPVERLRLERERAAARTAAHVLARVLDWHRARSLAADAALPPEDAQRLELDALDAEVELDVLTGGWFGARAARYGEPERPAANSPQPDERPGEAR